MSNPWVVIPLTYDAESLQLPDFTLYLWMSKGLLEVPVVRGEDVTVPSRPGTIESNRVNDHIDIELVGQVTADPEESDRDTARAQWWTMMRYIRTLFASNRERADLVAYLPDGGTATISARPMNILIPDQIDGEYASLSIEMEGTDDWTFAEAS
jgi:hypothetical protein